MPGKIFESRVLMWMLEAPIPPSNRWQYRPMATCYIQSDSLQQISLRCAPAGRVHQLEQLLRHETQAKQEAELQLHYVAGEAQELRAAKEAAVVEKEQVAVRCERRTQAHEVCA